MKRMPLLLGVVAITAGVIALLPPAVGYAKGEVSPIYGVAIPDGYRDWKLIAVAQLLVPRKADQLRAQFGNDIAVKAFRDGTHPFPEVRLLRRLIGLESHRKTTTKYSPAHSPGAQSFVVGPLVNVQFMIKDSKKYASTGGWGFADFKDNKPGDKALHETCFPCHKPAIDHDYIFTHHAP
jgi:hypothetical protein